MCIRDSLSAFCEYVGLSDFAIHKQGFCHIKTAFEMKKLAAYTGASNCTDLTDRGDGIAEIHEAMKTCGESLALIHI